MEQEVRDSNQTAVLHGNESMHGLLTRKESLPGDFGDVFRERGWTLAPVKMVVSIPERPPTGVVDSLNRPYEWGFSHFAICYFDPRSLTVMDLIVGSNRRS